MASRAPDRGTRSTAGLKVIDVDTHLSESEDLWTRRAPAKYRERVPQIGMVDDQISWVIDGNLPIGIGAGASSIFHKDGRRGVGVEGWSSWRVGDVIPACSEAKARVAMMDEAGIHAQIVYGLATLDDASRAKVMSGNAARVYNIAL